MEEQTAFQQLKDALLQDTILAHPCVEEDKWVVDTDASARAIGAVLAQEQEGLEKVIRYASKELSPAQQRYCTTKRELLGATWALKTFHHYLQGRKCILRTDHASVRWWKTMETGMPDVVRRWLLHISTYDVEIEYRPGRLHGNADGLSRPPLIEDCHARGCICAQARENLENLTMNHTLV
jgi:hypothetical protein